MLNPNDNENFEFELLNFGLSSALDIHVERVNISALVDWMLLFVDLLWLIITVIQCEMACNCIWWIYHFVTWFFICCHYKYNNKWISFCWKKCKILDCRLHWTSTWRGLIFQCWWNASICEFTVTVYCCYSLWNGMQLFIVNISLCHLVLHLLSLQI